MTLRKIVVVSLLPLLACGTLVGVGFASWYFGVDAQVTDTKNISVYTSSNVEKGELSIITAPNEVVFSQGEGNSDLKDGINYYIYDSNDKSYKEDDTITLKYTPKNSIDTVVDTNNFKMYVSFSGTTFSSYIKVTEEYTDSADSTKGYDYSSKLVKDSKASSSDTNGDIYCYTYTLKLSDVIEYYSVDVKPLTQEKYTSLQSSLTDAKISITFVAI